MGSVSGPLLGRTGMSETRRKETFRIGASSSPSRQQYPHDPTLCRNGHDCSCEGMSATCGSLIRPRGRPTGSVRLASSCTASDGGGRSQQDRLLAASAMTAPVPAVTAPEGRYLRCSASSRPAFWTAYPALINISPGAPGGPWRDGRGISIGDDLRKPPSTIDRLIGARLRECRMTLGLSQLQLSELIGVTSQQVHKYERGISSLSAGRFYQVACLLGAPIEYFFEAVEQNEGQVPPRQPKLLDLMRSLGEIDSQVHLKAISDLTRVLSDTPAFQGQALDLGAAATSKVETRPSVG